MASKSRNDEPKEPSGCSQRPLDWLRIAMRTAVTPMSSVAVPEKPTGDLTVEPAAGAVTPESGSRFTDDVVVVDPAVVVVVVGIVLDVEVDVELVLVVPGMVVVVLGGPVVVVAPVVLVGPLVVVEGADPGSPPGTLCHDV